MFYITAIYVLRRDVILLNAVLWRKLLVGFEVSAWSPEQAMPIAGADMR